MSAQAGTELGLLSLPPEICSQIYRALLPAEVLITLSPPHKRSGKLTSMKYSNIVRDPLYDSHATTKNGEKVDKRDEILSLLQVSRSVHDECKKILWSRGTFAFKSQVDVVDILNSMTEDEKALIHSATINVSIFALNQFSSLQKAIDMLTSCVGMKSIMLNISAEDFAEIIGRLKDQTWIDIGRRMDYQKFERFPHIIKYLKRLCRGQDWGKCERGIRIEDVQTWNGGWHTMKQHLLSSTKEASIRDSINVQYEWMKDTVDAMHDAWGGRFYLGDRLIWDNHVEVQHSVHLPERNRMHDPEDFTAWFFEEDIYHGLWVPNRSESPYFNMASRMGPYPSEWYSWKLGN